MKRTRLVPLFEGASPNAQPLLFLDFDDVLCVGPYGARDVLSSSPPQDLYERLWHPPAVTALLEVLAEHQPRVVLTTSWLGRLDRSAIAELLRRTGLTEVDASLHPLWSAPARPGESRIEAIESWLNTGYRGERLVVLDDIRSGSSLPGSRLDSAGCVLLCEVGVGLHVGHLNFIRQALGAARS
ncbi:HAD domain-containing protein [Variovorax sp. YR216]|uniref:HAD domain-containing protein n=1 Tax=Variovorax sp. YR216 TaxID=1882828 RepID=UPI000B811D3A